MTFSSFPLFLLIIATAERESEENTMADMEAIAPEGDAPATEEPTAPQVERRSSIGDMVKDLEKDYEEALITSGCAHL